jgi:alpha-beta hydrolase superfamily lysophospholipase
MKTFTLKHDFEIKGEILKPRGRGPFITVLLVHGYLGFMHQKQFRLLSEYFIKEGFAVVRFDFSCGQGQSEGRYEQARISRWQEELSLVIEYVKTSGFCKHLVLLGHSLGGLLSAQQAHKADALITLNGLYALPLHIHRYNYAPKEKVTFKLPFSFIVDMLLHLRMPRWKKLHIPILIAHAQGDEVVSVTQAYKAHKKFRTSELFIFPSSEHTLRDEKTIMLVAKKFSSWIKSKVKTMQ